MRDSIERDSAGLADDPNEDTIEFVLSPEELLSLSKAAAEAQSEPVPVDSADSPPLATPPHPEASTETAKVNPQVRRRRMPFEAATVLAVTAIALASAAYRNASPPARVTAGSSAVVSASAKTAPESQGEPVRFRNPFDPSEVFEFPPGTSEAAARASVADLLLERGRGRLNRPIGTRRINAHHARSPRRQTD
jgi:hypothetical protein